ncbi:metallophosphoesterase 1 [Trichechus manatus latirostris]|uniref:Metallophosphoesterase 1 n=1 Tax=Trichechus manatus latirostris TaxID=127582 RepID=A0A2Y9RMY1_TRIMA|nr:metallophosphoesterase 1 [Trichechus manatus latirostris]
MERAFQTALWLLQPELVFILGDIFDEGKWSSPQQTMACPALQLLWWLQPRLVLSGHTHSACHVIHSGGVPEVSVPSFSWRNRNNPSFIMGSITATDYSLSKCYLPLEGTVLATYCGAAVVLLALLLAHFELLALPFLFGWNLLRKHKVI